MKPTVWFERPPLSQAVDRVASVMSAVAPSSLETNPYEHLDEAIGAIVGVLPFDGAVMDRAPELTVIARTGIGYDSVDLSAATERTIAVCNAPDGPTISTAEQAITLALSVAKSVRTCVDRLAAGESDLYARHEAIEFDGKTMGLVGFGRIGRRVARIAHGFGMRVVVYDPYVHDVPVYTESISSLDAVLGQADVVSMHIPMSAATAHICNDEFFSAMRAGGIFINTARGGLVDQEALLRAVNDGRLFGAGLDVTDPEPLPIDHPLLNHDRVVVTPHVAAGTNEAKEGNFLGALAGVESIIAKRRPGNLVNDDVWPALAERIGAAT